MARFTRIEIDKGPDDKGRYGYYLFWKADWRPGDGPEEDWRGHKGQGFLTGLPKREEVGKVVDRRSTKTRLVWGLKGE